MDKHRIIISPVLALGDLFDKTGKLIKPVDGSVERLRRSVHCIDDLADSSCTTLYVASAGHDRRSKTVSQLFPHSGRPVSLADQMKNYLRQFPVEADDMIPPFKLLAKPLCWSTRSEIRVAIKRTQRWMAEHGYTEENAEVLFVVASHWAHLPRIWLYCKWYLPKGWYLKLLRANHAFSWRSKIIELPKFLRDILLLRKTIARFNRARDKMIRFCTRRIPRGYGK